MSVTWSPTNKNANVTLSNGNLTATVNVSGPADAAGIATTAATSGQKIYFEITCVAEASGEDAVGLANSSFTFADGNYLGIDSNSIGVYGATGNLWTGNTNQNSYCNFNTGEVVGVAIDLTNKRLWLKNITTASLWNKTSGADPATNVGGFDTSSITGNLFPAYNVSYASSQASFTANFGATSFAGTKPSGFTALDSGGSGVSLSLAATEAADTASFSASLKDSLSLAATEAKDTAAFSASLSDALSLAATEAKDIAAFSASLSDVASLAATESADTASFTLTSGAVLSLAATEASDTASISAALSDALSLAATEAPDIAGFAISISGGQSVWIYGEPEKHEPEAVVSPEAIQDPRSIARPTLRLPLISEAEIRALARNAYSPADVRKSVSAILQARREDDEETILLLT